MSFPTTRPTLSIFNFGTAAMAAGALFAAGACGGSGADPETTQKRLSETVPGVVDNASGSMDVLAESDTLATLGQSFDSLEQAFSFIDTGEESEGGYGLLRDGHDGDSAGGEMSGEDVANMLTERIFTEENYEGEGYYRLGGELFCPPNETTGEPDPECVETIDELELRLRAELAGENGVDIGLAIGPDRIEPVVLELRPDSVAVVAFLGEIREAALLVADFSGENVEVPDVLEGVAAATLIVHGEEHVAVEGAVREEIRVEQGDTSVSLAARDPMVALEVNGPEQSVSSSLDVGPLQVQAPWSAVNQESSASGTFELDWQGLTADVTLEEGAETLQIENVSVGDDTSTISLDGDELFAVDLNPDSGRSYTLTVLPQEGELPTFGFDPELVSSFAFGLQPLADAGDEVPEFLLDDTYTFAVTGSEPTLQPVDAQGEFTGGVRVNAGELSVTSSGAERDVVVAEGSCLVERQPEEGDHPLLGTLAAGACE